MTTHTPRITGRRIVAAAIAMVAALTVVATPSPAKAANISKFSTFACGWADVYRENAVTVYFPNLYTNGGYEPVYFSPDLYKYTSSGWQLVDGTKPWYKASVGPNGILTVNGNKWVQNGTQTGYPNIQFRGLSAGYYAVKSYFYGGPSHWATVWDTANSTSCRV
jgi:hypothetical protein